MRVRAYIRRSCERENSVSLEVQHPAIILKLERDSLVLDSVAYVDDGRSAFRDDIHNQPALQQALADAKRGEFDVLIVHKWDRLSRSETTLHGLIAEFRKCNVSLVSATEGDELLTPQTSTQKEIA